MKKLTYILFASTALFVNSSAFGLEAKLPSTSITQALQDAKNRNNYATLKSAKFDVKQKVYNITYVTKSGDIETIKISKVNGKEVK